jgi:hypothetical protein
MGVGWAGMFSNVRMMRKILALTLLLTFLVHVPVVSTVAEMELCL